MSFIYGFIAGVVCTLVAEFILLMIGINDKTTTDDGKE